MKKIILAAATALLMATSMSAQAPVKHHDWAFMGLEAGSNYSFWSVTNNPYHKITPQPGWVASMHIEFLFGNRQQHGINANVGAEALVSGVQEIEKGGTHRVQSTDVFVALGYKYTFRNQIFLEVRPQYDIYAACKRSINGTTEAEHDPNEKSPSGFSVGVGTGYNFTDNIAMFLRYKKGFGDMFNSVGVMPLECKETCGVLEMGITFGLTL